MDQELKNQQFFRICQQLFTISFFSLYAAIALEPSSSSAKPLSNKSPIHNPPALQQRTFNTVPAPLARLDDWRFYPESIELEFTLSAGVTPHHFYLAQPPRIVVDLPDTKLGYVPTQQSYLGAIQSIRVSQLKAGVTRIVLDLAPGNFADPNQVQLQPVSGQNPTRWVLRPFIRGYSNSLQPGNYTPTPHNSPPSPYNYPQAPSNLPPSPYNYPQAPSNLPPSPYNYPQAPINLPPRSYNYPLPPNNLSPTNNNSQQPFVTVPPLTPQNPSQLPTPILPPATFSNQLGNSPNPNPLPSPNFPVPLVPSYPSNVPPTEVIEFGQPLGNKVPQMDKR